MSFQIASVGHHLRNRNVTETLTDIGPFFFPIRDVDNNRGEGGGRGNWGGASDNNWGGGGGVRGIVIDASN